MKDIILFGNKNEFAIQIGYTKNPKKFLLQFFFQRIEMGNFKKSADLKTSIECWDKIIKSKEVMYLNIFDEMTKEELWKYLTYFNFNLDSDSDRYKMLRNINIYPLFGLQFANQQSNHVLLYKENVFRLLWRNDFGKPVNEAAIDEAVFIKVFEEYKTYCYEHNLL